VIAPEMLLPFVLASLAICLAPGPDLAFVVASGISAGRRGGVLAAVGITLGVSVYVVLTAVGLASLLRTVPAFAGAIRIGGAVYLGYMAFITWRAAGSATISDDSNGKVRGSTILWRGLITNLTNPKVILFFTAFLTQFVDSARGPVALQLLLLGLTLQLIGLAVDGTVGLAAGTVRDVFAHRPYLYALLDRAAASVFAVLACTLLVEVSFPG
jgi:threonine/homoserine/homoserine lactone efflux protein